jgi:cyclohexanecarboxylate-CoA ligase
VGPPCPRAARRRTDAGRDAATGRPADPFARLLAGEPVRASAAAPSDVAAVLFTAGSTGGAKGVVHTRRTLAAKARSMPARHGLGPADTVLMPAPLAHISGLLNGLLVPTVAGMTTVMMAVWQPALALELLERERVSFMVGPPTVFHALAAESTFHPRRVRSLRLISTGGAGVTPAFVDDAASTFGARVKRAYGSTEAPTVTTCGPDDPPERGRDTDGRAVGDTEVRVVDPDTATDRAGDRPDGVEGEVWVRGPEVAAGYLDAEQTAVAFARGGWFRTGDLGRLDDGWLTITGRRQAVIIRGGENIAIGEVEAVLESHPAVRHAVVLGQPDERLGERVAAFVVLTGTAPFTVAEARAWFTDRGIARFKTPEVVEVLSDMPVLAAGKPDRVTLRGLLGDGVDPTP